MYAVEFECFVKGNTLEIPAHLLRRISKNRQVKVIMLMPETTETAQATSQTALKKRLLAIAKRCAALPMLDRLNRRGEAGVAELAALLQETSIEAIPVTPEQATLARLVHGGNQSQNRDGST